MRISPQSYQHIIWGCSEGGGKPLADASNKANSAAGKKPEPAVVSQHYWDRTSCASSDADSSRLSNSSTTSTPSLCAAKSLGRAREKLQGHPKYNELMNDFPEFIPLLNKKIEASATDKKKALAEQQGLILHLKEAVTQLIAKNDQLLELVCANDDVQWQQEDAFRARLSQAADEAEERYQKLMKPVYLLY